MSYSIFVSFLAILLLLTLNLDLLENPVNGSSERLEVSTIPTVTLEKSNEMSVKKSKESIGKLFSNIAKELEQLKNSS